jgi:lysophospholipase L1-like esterase
MPKALTNLVLMIGSLLVFGGVVEGGLRLAGRHPEEPVIPVFSWKGTGEFWLLQAGENSRTRIGNHPVQVNALGLRDREIGPCEPADQRILFLGDSVTYGHGQAIEATFVREIERALPAHTGAVHVINAGIPGWSTRQELAFYREHGPELCPDLVLVGFVLNDVNELKRGLVEIGAERSLAATRAITWLATRSAAFAFVKETYATALDPASREIGAVHDLVQRADAPEVQHAMDLVENDLQTLAVLVHERGARFGLVLFPFRFQLEGENLDAPQARLRSFAASNQIPVFDTIPVLRQHEPGDVLMDHDHFTALGHRVVGQAIADWIRRERLLAAGGRSEAGSTSVLGGSGHP